MAVDANGNVAVVGSTSSSDFPTKNQITVGYTVQNGTYGFAASLAADGASLNYSSILGGGANIGQGDQTYGSAVTFDANGNAYIAGTTVSSVLPVTPGALHTVVPSYPNDAAFVMKLGPSGNLLTSAILGNGKTVIGAAAIALDPNGNIYLTGSAPSGWPTTAGAYIAQSTQANAGTSPYVSKLRPDESAFVYSTYLCQDTSG